MRIILVLSTLLFAGCAKGQKPLCEVGKLGTEILADQVASQLACKNKAAIKATMDAFLVDKKVCDAEFSAKSIIGDIVCPRLVPGLVGIIKNKIPSEWECTGGELKDNLEDYLLTQCKASL